MVYEFGVGIYPLNISQIPTPSMSHRHRNWKHIAPNGTLETQIHDDIETIKIRKDSQNRECMNECKNTNKQELPTTGNETKSIRDIQQCSELVPFACKPNLIPADQPVLD